MTSHALVNADMSTGVAVLIAGVPSIWRRTEMWAFLLNPYKPPARPLESAWCSQCACWRTFDTIPAIPDSGVPAFTICGWCGAGIDYEETA